MCLSISMFRTRTKKYCLLMRNVLHIFPGHQIRRVRDKYRSGKPPAVYTHNGSCDKRGGHKGNYEICKLVGGLSGSFLFHRCGMETGSATELQTVTLVLEIRTLAYTICSLYNDVVPPEIWNGNEMRNTATVKLVPAILSLV